MLCHRFAVKTDFCRMADAIKDDAHIAFAEKFGFIERFASVIGKLGNGFPTARNVHFQCFARCGKIPCIGKVCCSSDLMLRKNSCHNLFPVCSL